MPPAGLPRTGLASRERGIAKGRRRGHEREALAAVWMEPQCLRVRLEARPQHGAFEGRKGRVQARLHALVGLNMFPKSGHFGLAPFFFSRLSGQVSSRGTRSRRNLKPKLREIGLK